MITYCDIGEFKSFVFIQIIQFYNSPSGNVPKPHIILSKYGWSASTKEKKNQRNKEICVSFAFVMKKKTLKINF